MCVVFCVGSGICDELIARLEESHRVCVSACDLDRSTMSGLDPSWTVVSQNIFACVFQQTLRKRTSLSDRLQLKFPIYLQTTTQFTEVSKKETNKRNKIRIYYDTKKSQNKKTKKM